MLLTLIVLVALLAGLVVFLGWQLLQKSNAEGGGMQGIKTNIVTVTNVRTFHRTNYVTNAVGGTNEVMREVTVSEVREVSNTVVVPIRRDNVVGVGVGGLDGVLYYQRRIHDDWFLGLGVESRAFTNLYFYFFVSREF